MIGRFISFAFAILMLSACSGTGTSNYSYVAPVIDSDAVGKVFVLRDSGFVGGGALIDISVNGQVVGQLGNGEMLIADSQNGTNVISAKVSGLQGVGLNAPVANFQNDGSGNNFFLVNFKTGLLSNEMVLLETSQESWKAQSQ